MRAVPATTAAAMTGSNGRDNSMAYERLRNSGLTQALTDLLADLGDLVQKEIQLAKAEVTDKITSRLRACEPGAGASLGLFAGGCRIRRRRGGHVLSRPLRGGD